MMAEQKESVYYPEFVYSAMNRILHWVRAISITILTVTGLYIASPFLAPTGEPDSLLFGEWLFWHLVVGFVLISGGDFTYLSFLL
jgi:Ni/Fe-hydrogenase 1 B-type cytochrome subunit